MLIDFAVPPQIVEQEWDYLASLLGWVKLGSVACCAVLMAKVVLATIRPTLGRHVCLRFATGFSIACLALGLAIICEIGATVCTFPALPQYTYFMQWLCELGLAVTVEVWLITGTYVLTAIVISTLGLLKRTRKIIGHEVEQIAQD